MLRSIQCRNYRSLEGLAVPLSPMTAIVGPNGAGKTSILRAVGLLLGDNWPSMRSFRIPNDFTGFDANNDLVIEVGFEPALATVTPDALGKQYPVGAFRGTLAPYKRTPKKGEVGDLHFEFQPFDPR